MAQHIFIKPEDHPSVIVIGIKSKEKLQNVLKSMNELGIDVYPFFEPMFDNDLTAFATIPLDINQQLKLKKFQLIKKSHFCNVGNDSVNNKEII